MLQQDKLTGLSYRLGPDTDYNRSLLLKRHSPMHNPDEEQFPQGEKKLEIKCENLALNNLSVLDSCHSTIFLGPQAAAASQGLY